MYSLTYATRVCTLDFHSRFSFVSARFFYSVLYPGRGLSTGVADLSLKRIIPSKHLDCSIILVCFSFLLGLLVCSFLFMVYLCKTSNCLALLANRY